MHLGLRPRAGLVACGLAAWCGVAGAQPLFGPYKHAPMAFDAASHRLTTAAGGTARPLPEALPPGVNVVNWAFAIGECGQERWGEGIDTERFAKVNTEAFARAGMRYIVSTGGQGQQFTCGSDEGMERFIARYRSPQLVGFDFDIEAGQSDAAIDSLVRRVKAAQARHPTLRFMFTLPTFAASDNGRQSLNRIGRRVLQAIRRHGLEGVYINLMVMNYGSAVPRHCVLKQDSAPDGRTNGGARCDMGRSALQAALNLHARHGVLLKQIELTAMPGVNDVVHNVFTLEDAAQVARDVRAHGLGGLYYWSLDRDTACGTPAPKEASPSCSGLPQAPAAFAEAFARGLSAVRE